MRKLSVRERGMLACLAVVAIISGYILFFHMPMTDKIENLQLEVEQAEALDAQLDARLVKQHKMEETLAVLSANGNAMQMPKYDNVQMVMIELHRILTSAHEYALTFQTEQGEDNILRRYVTIPFTCGNYQQAKNILLQLHNSPLRNFLADLQVVENEDGSVHTTVVMAFFEYSKSPVKEVEETETTE